MTEKLPNIRSARCCWNCTWHSSESYGWTHLMFCKNPYNVKSQTCYPNTVCKQFEFSYACNVNNTIKYVKASDIFGKPKKKTIKFSANNVMKKLDKEGRRISRETAKAQKEALKHTTRVCSTEDED